MKNVTFLGAGYVGLTTGVFFAGGHRVCIYDPNTKKLDAIHSVIAGGNDLYIHESGLPEMVRKNANNITITDNLVKSLSDADIIFISVGTPPNAKGRANLKYVVEAARSIGRNVKKSATVLTKSTVPPGTGYMVDSIIKKELEKRGVNFAVAVGSCPEFLAEGSAMEDLRLPSRIVVGMDDNLRLREVVDFFTTMYSREKIFATTLVNAELIKYASNAMLSTRVSFVNNLAIFCDLIGADIKPVTKGMGLDPRIGPKFLNAGYGYGGSCFPKDTRAIAEYAHLFGTSLDVIDSTISINDETLMYFERKILEEYGDDLCDKNIAVWGVAFKAGTDDVRESRAIVLIKKLISYGANMHVYDPVSGALRNLDIELSEKEKESCRVYDNQYAMFTQAQIDGLIIGNEDVKFRTLDPKVPFRNKVVFDGKNILPPSVVRFLHDYGFTYYSVGRDVLSRSVDSDKLVSFLEGQYMD